MTTYTDRYVAAATRAVPDSAKDDLRAELGASITDAVEARVAAGEEPTSAERAVLTDLGDPARLAAEYGDRPLYLIGPRYYLTWRRLLTPLLAIVPPIVGAAVALGGVLAGEPLVSLVVSVVSTMLMVVGGVAFWTTLVFAVIERTGATAPDDDRTWTPDDLPEITPTQSGLGELVSTLSLLALAVAAVVWDHTHGFVDADGVRTSILSPDLWPWAVAGLFTVLALEAAVAVAVYRRGYWTIPLAAANALLSLAFAVPALWLMAADRLLNPVLLDDVIAPVSSELAGMVVPGIAIGIVVASAIDIGDAAVKALRARRFVSPD